MRKFLGRAGLLFSSLLLSTQPSAADPSHQWTETYDGGAAYVDDNTVSLVDSSGNLILGGESYDGIDGSDMLIRKLDRHSREALWSTRYPAFDGNDMALTDMVLDNEGNVLVAGYVRGCVG
jgi:hypothetical protein